MELLNHLAALLTTYMRESSSKATPLKQGCWQRKFLISCFVCTCHCFVTGASQTTWKPQWLSRYSDVLRVDVPKIIWAHSDEPEAHTASCAMRTGSISQRKSVRGVAQNAHPLVCTAIPLPPFCAVMACNRAAFTFNRPAVYACY
jgi:hypothetical protein